MPVPTIAATLAAFWTMAANTEPTPLADEQAEHSGTCVVGLAAKQR